MSKLAKALAAAAGNSETQEPDPYFNYVSLLLGTDGFDGGQNNTFTDSSVNDLTLTATSDIAQGSFNPFGDDWSNYFDGPANNSYLRTSGGATFNGDLTAECWVNCDYIDPTGGVIFDFRGGANNANPSVFAYSTGQVGMYINNTTYDSGVFILNDGEWHHIALVRSSSVYTLYIDGVSTTTLTYGIDFTSARFQIGADDDGSSNAYYGGYISNVRIVNGTAVYTSAFTPPTEPLTAISGTELLTCQSYGFKDASTNDFTITTTGTPKVTKFSPFAPSEAYDAESLGGSAYFPNTTTGATGHQFSTPATADLDIGSGDFTIECFYYATSIQNYSRVLWFNETWANSNAAGLAYRSPTGGKLSFAVYNIANPVVETDNDMQLFRWYHIAVTRTGNNFAMYVDGVKQASTYTSSGDIFTTSTPTLYVANGPTSVGGYSPLQGWVANARVVKGTAVYSDDFTPPTSPVTAVSGTAALINFEDSSIYDFAETNNLLTVADAQVDTAVTKFSTGSMKFDGTGDYLKVFTPDKLNLSSASFTIEGWINVSSVDTTYRCVFSVGPTVQIYARSGSIQCWFSSTDSTSGYIVSNLAGPSSSISVDTWHHIAVVRDGTTFTAYVDGVAGTPATGVTAAVSISATDASVGIYATSVYPFTGYIEDLRITKGIARYTAAFTPPTAAFPNF